jgi:agmatinase
MTLFRFSRSMAQCFLAMLGLLLLRDCPNYAMCPTVMSRAWVIPFDAGTSFRPGARFGPQAIRQASRHLRTHYHPAYNVEPFMVQQVADAGDIACNPYHINQAIEQIEAAATELLQQCGAIISLGGDHTIAYPLLKAINQRYGPVALVHFDAHLDT